MAKAPKRKVVHVEKVGEWGQTLWRHQLECGHVEQRKRVAPSGVINCDACVLAAAKAEELRSLPAAPMRAVIMDVDDLLDPSDDDVVEIEANTLRAGLAKRFNVQPESVDVVLSVDQSGRLVVGSAVVFLSGSEAKRLATNS